MSVIRVTRVLVVAASCVPWGEFAVERTARMHLCIYAATVILCFMIVA